MLLRPTLHFPFLGGRPFAIGLLLWAIIFWVPKNDAVSLGANPPFHTTEELSLFTTMLDTLPGGYNGLFAGSGACVQCHGLDTAMVASVDPLGNDINVVDDWRATMMANSAKDPFWRAKVSHEVLIYPQHQAVIETKCTSCHAPLGHFAAFHQGATEYTIADLEADEFGLDGVSCLACHQQPAEDLGNRHSGDLLFDTAKVAYGPFVSPLSSPMLLATNYEPVFSEHISDAGLCAGCHTLITETIDYEGNFTGGTFVEQATYHEWLNSRYEVEDVSCQDCHLPELTKGQFFLVNDLETEARDRFYLHELVGANTTMLGLLRDNAEELGIAATADQFNEVIAATETMLRQKSLFLELEVGDRTLDTAFISVELTNMAGHKLPSGYPSRRMFIELLVQRSEGDTLFISGEVDEEFELINQASGFESHHRLISSEDQVQIYELVMGDVNGEVTTVLERADYALKDNRIPPAGFSMTHSTGDTTAIIGSALLDPDFNWEDDQEGAGRDMVLYHIPLAGYGGPLIVSAKVYYQATPLRWMQEMFAESSPEIAAFEQQFMAADRQPFLMREDSMHLPGIVSTTDPGDRAKVQVRGGRDGQLFIDNEIGGWVAIFTVDGKLLQRVRLEAGNHQLTTNHTQQVLVVLFEGKNSRISDMIWMY